MQNTYLEMMQTTQRLIERANDISSNAERVTTLLREHKRDLAEMQDMVTGRSEAIRKILSDDEANYRERFALLQKELDEAIALIQGAPPEVKDPEPPIEPPVEPPAAEVAHG